MKLATADAIAREQSRRAPFQSIDSARISEPRIELIQRRLQALLRIVQLESGGEPLEVDSFRLRSLGKWTGRVAGPISELWHISTMCNMRCPFCYEEGDPEEASVLNEPPEMATMSEIETRLRYRNSKMKTGIFQPLTYINEIFCNPRAMDIIERIRAECPDEVLTFVTNGTYLTEDMVKRLAKLKPVFFNFSVNSVDPEIRRRILRDQDPTTAINALRLLREHEIPYLGSLVCWPTIPWSDVRNTVKALDAADCTIVRFSLSAYSKHLKGMRFDRRDFWSKGLTVAKELMSEVAIPIKVEPYHYMDPTNQANIAGVIKGSPAALAGLKAGYRINSIDGVSVPSVNHALTLLAKSAKQAKTVALKYEHNFVEYATELAFEHQAGALRFPFTAVKDFKGFECGLVLVDNLRFSYLAEVDKEIQARDASRVLICSSELMRPVVQQMISEAEMFAEKQMFVEVPENRHFGGTIVLGDLLTVSDYVSFIKEYREHTPIDLVIVPSSPFSLGSWKRDLTGVPFTEIERQSGIPVALIKCQPLQG